VAGRNAGPPTKCVPLPPPETPPRGGGLRGLLKFLAQQLEVSHAEDSTENAPAGQPAVITLLKQFTWAAPGPLVYLTEWVRVPEQFQNWQLLCLVHGRITNTSASTLNVLTSWDMNDFAVISPSSFILNTIGLTLQSVSSGVGPFVRLRFEATADSVVTLSFFLTPKQD
jgi:hypothetical protein